MREIIRTCIRVQFEYSNIPLQDRIYIAFGRIVTEKSHIDDEALDLIIRTVKSEFEFLEGVWHGEKGEG